MKVTLIYAYWSNQPFEMTWCDLPWALRDAGLPKRLHHDGHDVRETIVVCEESFPEELRSGFILAGKVAEEVKTARDNGELPVILCGSCAVAALAAVAGMNSEQVGVAWFDTHPDLNTPETTTSGLFEGMALAVAAGLAWYGMSRKHAGLSCPVSLANVAFYGTRQVEDAEQALIDMHQIPKATTAVEINERLSNVKQVYIHLDMDVHDSLSVRTNTFSAPDGPTVGEVREVLVGVEGVAALAITGLDPAAADTATASRIAIEHVLAIAGALDDLA
ncbi:MAG: arginase family protein [Hyphomicrobiaceae bacterium]